jgi:hypothetical protein
MQQGLLLLATSLSLIGTIDYISSIIKGKTKPHRTTRIVLFIVSSANLIGAVSAHAHWGTILLSILFFVRSFILALLSIKRGIGGMSKLDVSCGVIAVAGILAWLITGNGISALIFSVIADAVAYIPAVIKTWKLPKSEAPLIYWLEGVAAILAVIHDGLRISILFQVYIVISCIVMLVCIYRPIFGKEKISASLN